MSKADRQILAGLEEAVRYARGEDVPGLIVHAPKQTATDLAALDAHEVQPAEYDDLPELTDEDVARGTLMKSGKPSVRLRKIVVPE